MKNIKILVIDDSPSFILYIQDIFLKHNYKYIFTAYDRQQAEEILKQEDIHIILLDIELNTIEEGFQVGEYFQKQYDVPIIYITGKNESEIKSFLEKQSVEYSVYGLLYKPFVFSELEILLINVLKTFQEKKIQEKSYEKIIQLLSEPGILLRDRKIVQYNEEFKNFIENMISNSEITGKDILEFFPELEPFLKEIQFSNMYSFINTYRGSITKEIRKKNFTIKIEIMPIADRMLQMVFYVPDSLFLNRTNQILIKKKIFFIAQILDKMLEGIFILDENRNFIFVNQTFLKMFQFREEDLLHKNIKLLKSPNYPFRYYVKIWKDVIHKGIWEGKLYSSKKTGEERIDWVSITKVYDRDQNKYYYIGMIVDLQRRAEFEEHLFYLAHFDELTELPNRRYFKEVLRKEISRSIRNSTRFALIFIDLDNFKYINDNFGHLIGDQVLKYFAESLKKTLRKSDFIARYGGDEFCIITNQITSTTMIIPLLEKIIALTFKKFKHKDLEIPISLSLGIAFFPDDISEEKPLSTKKDIAIEQKLIEIADQKMYHAKKTGGNRYQFANEELQKFSDFRNAILSNYKFLDLRFIFQLIRDKKGNSIAIQPLPILSNAKSEQNFLSLFLETNERQETHFFRELIQVLKSKELEDIKNRFSLNIYVRFSSRIILNRSHIQELLSCNSGNNNIIIELTESEFLNLTQYHESFIHYLVKHQILFSIRKFILEDFSPLHEWKNYPIFSIIPHIDSLFRNLSYNEKINLEIFSQNMKVFQHSILLDKINSKEDKKEVQNLEYHYYKGKLTTYPDMIELKKVLHIQTLK